MKRNSQDVPEQDFKRRNKVSSSFIRPSPQHPKPLTKLYILSYVATRELERIKEKKLPILIK